MIRLEDLYELYKKCSCVTTDSRNIKSGAMFFALRGETFDGNDFAVKALEAGAKYAIVDRPALDGVNVKGRRSCILVDDVLDTMQKLAAYHRSQFDIPVVGVTGTNGKTTTKELINAVLSKKYRTVATKGNFNNHIGVPLTLFEINDKTQMAIVEMGASAPGEIAALVKLSQPTCGVVTNVGKAHLQGFGSFEGVKNTKGELYDYLRQKGGTVFYNADNPHLTEMISRRSGMCTEKYGVKHQDVAVLQVTAEEPYLRLILQNSIQISTHLVGAYNADNVLAAICIGRHFGVPDKDIFAAVEKYVPSNNRSQMVQTSRNRLIVDAYNANPTSMRAAIENFKVMEFSGKTLILGDMLELGADSLEEHKELLDLAMESAQTIYLVGGEFMAAAVANGVSGAVRCFATSDELHCFLEQNPLDSKTILVKGSHGTHLEKLLDVL
jgi:UDP-N-acetylmuramoyl-tripeptide--D-alanyl-D-alanine ligase